MPTDYGSGIYLSTGADSPPPWDMEVTNSGDVRTVSGPEELEKDVALSTTIRIGEEIGGHITPIVQNRIRARVLDALEDDVRINSVLLLEVNEIGDGSNQLEVVCQANAVEDETIELVFQVSE